MQDTRPIPLDKRTFSVEIDGLKKEIPGVHKHWLTERAFPRYTSPPVTDSASLPLGAKETWIELTQLLHEDFRWLLALPYNVFWSQIILTKQPIIALNSFLQEATPAYCKASIVDTDIQQISFEISRLVLLICRRLSTARENSENFMSMKTLGKILYDNYIFTVPSLLDICTVYGVTNRASVQTILENVTTMQPKYLDDLALTSPHLVTVLEKAKEMLVGDNKKPKLKDKEDVIVLVNDSLVTIRVFFQVFPRGVEIVGTPPFLSALATFYSAVIPEMIMRDLDVVVTRLRLECLRVARIILETLIDELLSNGGGRAAETYLALVSEIMSENVFVIDYHSLHPLDKDLDLLSSLCPDIDSLKINYLLEALSSHVIVLPKLVEKPAEVKDHVLNYAHVSSTAESSTSASGSNAVSGVELESLISQVQDILPHLGAGFVEACLRYYDFSSERVIAAVLESSLPPSLEELSFDLPRTPLQDTRRLNVFDHDEFDVMTHDTIDTTRAHRGKKPSKHKNLTQMLEDKTEINQMRDRFSTLGIVEDTTYDDEFDDTYDSVDLSVAEADEEKRRPFVMPRVLRTWKQNKGDDDDDDGEEEPEEDTVRRDHFVQNPEELRAKAEERRAEARRQRDVTGRAKGQGQTKEVLVNRNKKTVNKSAGANHHRRDRATQKRNKGMIPS